MIFGQTIFHSLPNSVNLIGTDKEQAIGFLTLLLQYFFAAESVIIKTKLSKNRVAFLSKSRLGDVYANLKGEIKSVLTKNALVNRIGKIVAMDKPMELYSNREPEPPVIQTGENIIEKIISGVNPDPILDMIYQSEPLGLEEAGEAELAPILETRHIRGKAIAPQEWRRKAEEMVTPFIENNRGKI